MKTPAIIASLTVAGSIAFAAGQQSGGRQSPPMPQDARHGITPNDSPKLAHQPGSGTPFAALTGSSDPCAKTNYFAPEPRGFGPGCGTLAVLPISPADVNADGTPELWVETTAVVASGCPWAPAQDAVSLLSLSRLEYSDTEPLPVTLEVARLSPDTHSSLMAMMPAAEQVCGSNCCGLIGDWQLLIRPAGWLDCDGDGDLDLVILASRLELGGGICSYDPLCCEYGGSCCGVLQCDLPNNWHLRDQAMFWFENIGYEASQPPLAADLNGDGQVNGADLGLLLVAWGPNP
jgi:hypothetical protein